jgi:arylsulfatase A-like enzyme
MNRRLLPFVCCIAACGTPPAAPPTAQAPAKIEPPPHLTLPGDRLDYRFVDHVDAAGASGDFEAGWRAIADHPQRALLPYSSARGAAAYRAVEMAFADSDVEDYATERDAFRGLPVKSLDPVWNRTRAVYSSRSALYLPAGAKLSFRVSVPQNARLDTEIGQVGANAKFLVTVDGESVFQENGTDGRWRRVSIDLARFQNREATIAFSVEAPPKTAHGFFADPILWSAGGGAPGPNVLVIVVDTLRADALAAMPHLSAFASRGARFTHAITAATWTRPSLLAIYGGDLASAVGQSAEEMIPADAERRRFYRLAPSLLPRILEGRGWRADALGNNFFLLGYPQIGLDLGFESVDDVRHPVLDTPAITRAAIRYFKENRDRSWLLHLHYDAPHWPYTPPAKYVTKRAIGDAASQQDPEWARYLGEAAYADDYLAQVFDALDQLDLAKRTMVIVVGDHGEIFDPAHSHTVAALDLPTLHHHGWSAYDEILRVPMIVVAPGKISPATVDNQVRLFDLAATIADYLDLPGGELPARGKSLRPVIEGRDKADRPAITEGQDVRALRENGWLYLKRDDGRLIYSGKQTTVAVEELYDLAKDPQQHHDLAASDAADLAKMRARFDELAPARPFSRYHFVAETSAGYDMARLPNVEMTLRSSGRIDVDPASLGSTSKLHVVDEHRVEVKVAGANAGQLDFQVTPPEAKLELTITKWGQPFDPKGLLAGEYGIPLIDGPLENERLLRLDARRPPQIVLDGDLHLWRDAVGNSSGTPAGDSPTGNDEVTGMMQRWGYAK